ncbi:D-glycero-beta-D-manno-heptose-7-phosphate kinase [Okibacterium endophyticum]
MTQRPNLASTEPAHHDLSTATAVTPELVEQLPRLAPTITVIGDLILDGWWKGHTERVSREAPAPVVDVAERVYSPGGAANTAMNLAALGARVRLVGLVGDDDAGAHLLEILTEAGVDVSGVVRTARMSTITKTRIVSDDHVLVRIDEGQTASADPVDLDRLAERIESSPATDAELVCDYGFGALYGPVFDALVSGKRRRAPLTVVDAHDPALWAPLRPDLVTPNAGEAARAADLDALRGEDRAAVAVAHADTLLAATGAAAVVVTLDCEGTVTVRADAAPHRTHAHPALEARASGAGDTFVAALTMARSCGLSLEVSTDFAQVCADVVVQRYGTSVCTLDDVTEQLGASGAAIDHNTLAEMLARDRHNGRRIVFTNGCFDVLHRGHTTYLAQAKRLGDVLVVAINADESVRRLKGDDRPVNAATDRASVLAALGCVDYVTVFDGDTPEELLERLRPDVYVKGGDYTPEMLTETAVVTGYGGEVRMVGYVPSHSTTEVVTRIRNTAPRPEAAERPDRRS